MAQLPIERRGTTKNPHFFLHDERITNKTEVERLKKLGIPPAWQDVKIARTAGAKVQATGHDASGRLQYIYSQTYRERQERLKFEKILKFAEGLPNLRKITEQHLQHPTLDKEKVLATIIQIMDRTYMRVGNEAYAQQNQHYGITTLRSKHTTVKGDTVIFDFVGKSGQEHHQVITDKRLARIVKRLDELPGYEIFRYQDENGMHDIHSGDVNAYIKEIMGDDFSAKDFRTWAGTMIAVSELAIVERAKTERERKKAITECVKRVSKELGNTPAIARASYIDPRVIKAYMSTDTISDVWKTIKDMKPRQYMRNEEACVMHLLEKS